MKLDLIDRRTYISHTVHVHNTQTIQWNSCIDNAMIVSLNHADVGSVAIAFGSFAKLFQEIHNVGTNIDVVVFLLVVSFCPMADNMNLQLPVAPRCMNASPLQAHDGEGRTGRPHQSCLRKG
jgi:hypothetical protein